MAFVVKENKGGEDFDPVPSGMHHAVCTSIIDIGTQPAKGQFPTKRKVMFTWELPQETIEVERDGKRVPLPRVISARYKLSLHKKAALRAMLESWRGRPFTEEELAGFDLERVLGANCFLNVVHKEVGDKTYANVASVNPLAKGMAKIEAVNPLISFFMDAFEDDQTIVFPDHMHKWIQKLVMNSEEYQSHGKPKREEDPNNPSGLAFPLDDSHPDLIEGEEPF